MPRSKYFSGGDIEYLKPSDLKNGQVITVSEFLENRSALGLKPCLKFYETGDKLLTLNQTNYDFFARIWGDMEVDWENKAVQVSIEQVKDANNPGKFVPGIRFKQTRQPNATSPLEPEPENP